MKRDTGLVAGLLLLLAFFGISNLSNRGLNGPPAAESGKSVAVSATAIPIPKGTPTPLSPSSPCQEIANRLQRLIKPSGPTRSWNLPKTCYETGEHVAYLKGAQTWGDVQFAMALVPNPVTTHLPLLFDRILETIQQAAQDERYIYDSSWFPWEAGDEDFSSLSDRLSARQSRAIQEAQPGVMVFRRALADQNSPPPYEGGLVIFVVAEQPTAGINDDEFDNALRWIRLLGGPNPTESLRIVGPTFSGSLASLQRLLEKGGASLELQSTGARLSAQIYSGSVSSRDRFWFSKWMTDHSLDSSFQTAMESDSVMLGRFCQYLSNQGYPLDRVAVLSEAETAFGGATEAAVGGECYDQRSGGAFYLYYPRDIAMLRSAYERQAVFRSAKPQSSANAPLPELRGDLSEPAGSAHDSVRSFGGQLTPMAQESILLAITNRLKAKQAQFVVLRSTNSLDQIFLSEFLQRAYPEGRVVIDGSDLMSDRGAEGRWLRGVMMFSTYPLLSEQQDWTSTLLRKHNGTYRVFDDDKSEGVYVAARELFGTANPTESREVPILDYAPPAWAVVPKCHLDDDRYRPATWISVVGNRQFWPLAVLNSCTLSGSPASDLAPLPPAVGDAAGRDTGDPRPLRLPGPMWILLLVCLLPWSVFHCFLCWHGSLTGWLRSQTYFAPVPRSQHPALIASGSIVLAMLAVVVAAFSGFLSCCAFQSPFHSRGSGVLLGAWVVTVLATVFWALNRNYRLPLLYSRTRQVDNGGVGSCAVISDRRTRSWHRCATWSTIVFLSAFTLLYVWLIYPLTPANRIPTYWRSVNLASGVSPLLPHFPLLAGMYLWFWFNLRGLAHLGEDRPSLPRSVELPKLDDRPVMRMFSSEECGEPVERASLPLSRRYVYTLAMVFAITFLVCGVGLQGIWVRTLGERAFGVVIFVWICLSLAVILTDAVQVWSTWKKLHRLLIALDRLPLRRTLRALGGLGWGSIWTMSGNVLEERYRMISLQLESLGHLRNILRECRERDWRSWTEALSLLQKKITECDKRKTEFIAWYVALKVNEKPKNVQPLQEFQRELASTAASVMQDILFAEWQKETDSLIIDLSPNEKQSAGSDRADASVASSNLPPHVRAAEEFFVLPYLAFIQNIFGRLHTIVLGSLCLFVTTALAVASYPFAPVRALGGIFLTVFVLAGGLTVLVYSRMCRDATLSHITNTKPGELGAQFWMRLVAFGIGPLLGLIATLFPSITDFVFAWVQPGVPSVN